ncbi:MAG: AF1514 family protein [Gammaproteobacteria bacterium]
MESVNIGTDNASMNFDQARRQAVAKAKEKLQDPVVIAWKDDRADQMAPEIPGGVGSRWHDYGENYGGKLEMNVGGSYHFIFSEVGDVDEPDLKLSNIQDEDGTTFLCLTEACTKEDRRRLAQDEYGGGIGGG